MWSCKCPLILPCMPISITLLYFLFFITFLTVLYLGLLCVLSILDTGPQSNLAKVQTITKIIQIISIEWVSYWWCKLSPWAEPNVLRKQIPSECALYVWRHKSGKCSDLSVVHMSVQLWWGTGILKENTWGPWPQDEKITVATKSGLEFDES